MNSKDKWMIILIFFIKTESLLLEHGESEEQRYVTKRCIKTGNDSFKIALFDGEIATENMTIVDTEKVAVSNYDDTILDTSSD
jgi:hypothetical protein